MRNKFLLFKHPPPHHVCDALLWWPLLTDTSSKEDSCLRALERVYNVQMQKQIINPFVCGPFKKNLYHYDFTAFIAKRKEKWACVCYPVTLTLAHSPFCSFVLVLFSSFWLQNASCLALLLSAEYYLLAEVVVGGGRNSGIMGRKVL